MLKLILNKFDENVDSFAPSCILWNRCLSYNFLFETLVHSKRFGGTLYSIKCLFKSIRISFYAFKSRGFWKVFEYLRLIAG